MVLGGQNLLEKAKEVAAYAAVDEFVKVLSNCSSWPI